MTRQREWQLRKIAEGKCQICGRAAVIIGYCRKHREAKNAWQLAYYHERKTST